MLLSKIGYFEDPSTLSHLLNCIIVLLLTIIVLLYYSLYNDVTKPLLPKEIIDKQQMNNMNNMDESQTLLLTEKIILEQQMNAIENRLYQISLLVNNIC